MADDRGGDRGRGRFGRRGGRRRGGRSRSSGGRPGHRADAIFRHRNTLRLKATSAATIRAAGYGNRDNRDDRGGPPNRGFDNRGGQPRFENRRPEGRASVLPLQPTAAPRKTKFVLPGESLAKYRNRPAAALPSAPIVEPELHDEPQPIIDEPVVAWLCAAGSQRAAPLFRTAQLASRRLRYRR